MLGKFGEEISTIAMAFIAVLILAVLVSKRSNTVNVVGALGNTFSQAAGAVASPVTGFEPSMQTVNGFGGF
ncbi:MAG TPA: hypothetical protein ENI61_04165 [Ignavibacteria bacterium]|nr:hypothetical protein [Ignavibacteria bacterium]